MGFNDEFLNYRLLQRYDGNVKRVISKIEKKNNRKGNMCHWRKHFKKENEIQQENEVKNESCGEKIEIQQKKISITK